MTDYRFADSKGRILEVTKLPDGGTLLNVPSLPGFKLSLDQTKVLVEMLQKHVNPEPTRYVEEGDFNQRVSALDADYNYLRLRIETLSLELGDIIRRVNALERAK